MTEIIKRAAKNSVGTKLADALMVEIRIYTPDQSLPTVFEPTHKAFDSPLSIYRPPGDTINILYKGRALSGVLPAGEPPAKKRIEEEIVAMKAENDDLKEQLRITTTEVEKQRQIEEGLLRQQEALQRQNAGYQELRRFTCEILRSCSGLMKEVAKSWQDRGMVGRAAEEARKSVKSSVDGLQGDDKAVTGEAQNLLAAITQLRLCSEAEKKPPVDAWGQGAGAGAGALQPRIQGYSAPARPDIPREFQTEPIKVAKKEGIECASCLQSFALSKIRELPCEHSCCESCLKK